MNMKEAIKATKDKTIPEKQTAIFTYDGKQKNGKQEIIDTKGKNLQNCIIQTRPDNKNIVLVSWYTNYELGFMTSVDVIHGLQYVETTPEGKIVSQYQTPMDASQIANLSDYLRIKKDNGLQQNVHLLKMYFQPNGNMLLLAEHTEAHSHKSGDTYYTTYTIKDAIVFCISPKAKIKWSVAIPKNLSSQGNNRTTFSFMAKDKLFLVYNGSDKAKVSSVLVSEINDEGKVKTDIVKGTDKDSYINGTSKLEGDGEVTFILNQDKKKKIVRISASE
jgi:hypothetical protein